MGKMSVPDIKNQGLRADNLFQSSPNDLACKKVSRPQTSHRFHYALERLILSYIFML